MSRKEQMSLLEAEARKTEVVLRHIQRRLEELENDEWLEQFLRQLEESEGG
jgi:ribosome assembly protein YihI (activator of Der GTPase)